MYDKWSKSGYEDFTLSPNEIETLENCENIKDILKKDKSDEEYKNIFKKSINSDLNSKFYQQIIYMIGIYFDNPDSLLDQLNRFKQENREVEDSISNTDLFQAKIEIEELKPYSDDGQDGDDVDYQQQQTNQGDQENNIDSDDTPKKKEGEP